MAITRPETKVLWAAANSKSVAFGATEESDEINLDATCVAAQVHLKADNAGTPAAGDTVDFYFVQTGGDPDGAAADEFDTNGHATHLKRLDTNSEDPAGATVPLPIPQKGGKVVAVSNAGSNSITVSATITEQRAA